MEGLGLYEHHGTVFCFIFKSFQLSKLSLHDLFLIIYIYILYVEEKTLGIHWTGIVC